MSHNDADDFLFQQFLDHPCIKYPIYIINGRKTKQNQPVDCSGYLIMINRDGDTIAGRSPGCGWIMNPVITQGTHPNIAKHPYAICLS